MSFEICPGIIFQLCHLLVKEDLTSLHFHFYVFKRWTIIPMLQVASGHWTRGPMADLDLASTWLSTSWICTFIYHDLTLPWPPEAHALSTCSPAHSAVWGGYVTFGTWGLVQNCHYGLWNICHFCYSKVCTFRSLPCMQATSASYCEESHSVLLWLATPSLFFLKNYILGI